MDVPQAISIGICVAWFLLSTFRPHKAIEICKECLFLLKDKVVEKEERFVQTVQRGAYTIMSFASVCLLDYKSGIKYCEKVLLILRELDERASSNLILTLAALYHRERKYIEAKGYYRRALDIMMETRDVRGESLVYGGLGTLCQSVGEFVKAREYLEKALKITVKIGDRIGEGLSYQRLGDVYRCIRQYDKAEEFLEKALAITKGTGDRQVEGAAYGNLGCVFRQRGEYGKAKEYLEKALVIMIDVGDKMGEAAVYGNLASVFTSLGEYVTAKALLEKALAIMPIEIDSINERVAVYVILGDVCTHLGDYDKAKGYLEKTLAISKETGDRNVEAKSHASLGEVLKFLGETDKALEYFKKALTIHKEIGDRNGEASGYVNLATLYLSLGKYAKAVQFCKKAIVLAKEIGDRKLDFAAYGNLGNAYLSLGDYSKAKECLEYALVISCELHDIAGQSTIYTNLGVLFQSHGEYGKAKEYIEKAILIRKKTGDRKGEAVDYLNLGTVFHHLSDYARAKEYLQKALTISEELGYRVGEAAAYESLGTLFVSLGDYVKAVEHLEKALVIVKAVGDRYREAVIYHNLGGVFHSLGEYANSKGYTEKGLVILTKVRHRVSIPVSYANLGTTLQCLNENEKAREYHERALLIAKEIGDRRGEAQSYGNLGTVFHSLREYRKAKEYYEKALAINKEIGDRKCEAAFFGYLGTVFQSLGEYPKALEYHEKGLTISKEIGDIKQQLECNCSLANVKIVDGRIQEAVNHLVASIQCCEDLQGFLKDNDQFKISILDMHVSPYQLLSGLYCAAGNPCKALRVLELGRARALADLMATQYFGKQIPFNPQSLDGIESIVKNENDCTCLYISYAFEHLCFWILKATRVTFRVTKAFENCAYARTDIDFSDFVAKLRLSMPCQENCEDRSLLQTNERQTAINSSQEGDKAFLRIVEDDEEEIPEPSLSLIYKLIIRPVTDLLEGSEIIIVPDRLLYNVPFAALQDESGKYLSESFKIRIVPSLTTLKLIQDSPADYHSQTGALIVGDPEVGHVTYKGHLEWISALPCARKEAEMIGRLVGAQPLIGKNATKQAVLDRINSVSLIHFAAHGNAERGEIALAPQNTDGIPEEEDYLLTMADISQARLRAKLVVLSCCHSANGQTKVEGVVGIARAFLGSGARSVLVALWAIQDNATEQLMSRFYEHLVRGESASESLHQAMKWMRSNGYSDVGQWAPFMLIGDNVTFHFGH